MKCLAGLLLLSFVLYTSAESYELEPRAVPQKCEDVLAQDLCNNLREIAAALKLKISKVDDAIKAAIAKGITTSKELVKSVKDFLKNEVIGRPCEDFLAPGVCARLRKICQALKIKVEKVEEAIKEVIVRGVTKVTDIYIKVVEYLKTVASKTCEDFVAARICNKLREIAKALKVKVEKINEFVIDAMIQGYKKPEEIYQAVVDFIRQDVLSKTCEDILATPICTKLKQIANNLKVKVDKVDKFVREAILKGKTTVSAIIEEVRNWIKNEVMTKTCEDFLPDKLCLKMKQVAAKLKVRAEKVDQAVKEALAKGKSKVTDIYNDVVDYLKANIQCEDFLGNSTCSRIRSIAKRLGVRVQEVEQKIRDLIAEGKTKVSDIWKKVLDFIKNKIFG